MPVSQKQLVERWFDNMPVVEAKRELRIQPNKGDIKGAVPNDPHNCVFSKACARMWNSHAVLFFGTVAYVDLLSPNGQRRVERFLISEAGQKFIREVDAGKSVVPGGFVLLPPTRSTLVAARNKSSRDKRKALLKGSAVVKKRKNKGKAHYRKPSFARVSAARSGRGMVQFPAQA